MSFGIQEYFIASQWLLKSELKLNFSLKPNTRLMSREYPMPKDGSLDKLAKLNTYDTELYNFASEELLRRIQLEANRYGLEKPKKLNDITDGSPFVKSLLSSIT